MRNAIATFCFVAAVLATNAATGTHEERLRAMEDVCAFIPSDALRDDDVYPSPEDVKARFGMTREEVAEDLKAIALKYDLNETNMWRRHARGSAIAFFGEYGTTNDLALLSAIVHNPGDYAQQAAVGATIRLTTHTDLLIPFVHSVVTNTVSFPWGIRNWTKCRLAEMCKPGWTEYVNDQELHSKIAAYFIGRAKEERESPLCIDADACELNPWYRHSQLRRDNLARARKPGLTGDPAKLYDAAEQDAAAEGD